MEERDAVESRKQMEEQSKITATVSFDSLRSLRMTGNLIITAPVSFDSLRFLRTTGDLIITAPVILSDPAEQRVSRRIRCGHIMHIDRSGDI